MENTIAPKLHKTNTSKLLLLLNIILGFCVILLSYIVVVNSKQIQMIKKTLNDDYVTVEKFDELKLLIPQSIGITPEESPLMAYEKVIYSGTIVKEEIPEEYALGDYWYIFYFDTPQVIETAYGLQTRESLEIQASTIDSLEPFLDQDVTVNGRLSYGYAESRIILADEVIIN